MRFLAVDLSKMRPDDLQFRPRPISQWPTAEVDVDAERDHICIASWRHDIATADEVSDRLSECAWDALHLGFSFMLCDIVSIPQTAPDLGSRIIHFSRLYEALPAVIAYDVDPEIKRVWLRHEASLILRSPTKLPYVYNKWTLRVPLIFSLVIRQICTRRLGIHDINTDKLPLCDDEASYDLSLRDLELFKDRRGRGGISTISLDRRNQTYASDVLLVYELNLSDLRPSLVSKLSSLHSNSVAIPALISIWALVEGLSISIRGCDWDVAEVLDWAQRALRAGCQILHNVSVEVAPGSAVIGLAGGVEGAIRPHIESPPDFLGSDQPRNLLIYNRGNPARASDAAAVSTLLEACVDFVQSSLNAQTIREPEPLSDEAPQYELGFDDTPGHGIR